MNPPAEGPPAVLAPLRLGRCVVDLAAGTIDGPRGLERLTRLEAGLLAYLADRLDTAVSRDELLQGVHGYGDKVLSRAVDHTVLRLRRKIEDDPAKPVFLLTEHGFGYRLRTPTTAVPEPVPEPPDAAVRLGDVRLRLDRGEAHLGGRCHELTSLEVGLLRYLLARPNRTVPRDELLRHVWHGGGTARGLDTAVYRLRCKIERDPKAPERLLTVHGHGLQLRVGAEAPPDEDVVLLFLAVDEQDRLWHADPAAMERGAAVVRAAVSRQAERCGGYPLAESAGILAVAFAEALPAVQAAAAVHREVAADGISVRSAVHRGPARRQPAAFAHKTAYVGPAVPHTARLLMAAQRGRIWVTEAALRGVDRAALPGRVEAAPAVPGLYGDPDDVTVVSIVAVEPA